MLSVYLLGKCYLWLLNHKLCVNDENRFTANEQFAMEKEHNIGRNINIFSETPVLSSVIRTFSKVTFILLIQIVSILLLHAKP